MPLDPAVATILEALNAAPGPKLHELSPEQARSFFDQMQLPAPEVPLAKVEDVRLPGPAGEIPVRIYRPEATGPLPVLVYFHGGGWVIGSIETHDATCRELAREAGCAVVSVEYRLAPEHRYPAAAEDCYAAVREVSERASSLGLDGSRIAIGGDSAGGNLTAVVAQMARDQGGPALRFQLLIYPVTDADFDRPSYRENASGYLLETVAMSWFWDHYVPDPARRAESYAAPLRAADLSGLPEALVMTAEFDPLRDEGEAYAQRLAAAGVPTIHRRYDGMIHGFFAMSAVVPRARTAVEEAAAALRKAFAA
jgi:acetyl esterase